MTRNKLIEGIERAFITSYGELEAAVHAVWPDATTFDVEAVALHMAAELFRRNRPLLYRAISEALYHAPEDRASELDDYVQDVFVHLLQKPAKLIGLLFPKRAKPTTALYGLAKSRMRGVRSKLSDRHAIVTRRLADFNATVREIAPPPDPQDKDEKMLAVA